ATSLLAVRGAHRPLRTGPGCLGVILERGCTMGNTTSIPRTLARLLLLGGILGAMPSCRINARTTTVGCERGLRCPTGATCCQTRGFGDPARMRRALLRACCGARLHLGGEQ